MIGTIISDLGNVLLRFDNTIFFRKLAPYTAHSPEDVRRVTAHYLAAGSMTRLVFPASAPPSEFTAEDPSMDHPGTDGRSDIE